jgi:hypothetical protein
MEEAIKILKGYAGTVFVVSVIWLVAYQGSVSNLTQRHRAQHLLAWLLIRGKISEEPVRQALLSKPNLLDKEIFMDSHAPGESHLTRKDIYLFTYWPLPETVTVTFRKRPLEIKSTSAVYEITADSRYLPISDYNVLVAGEGRIGVVPAGSWKEDKTIHHAVLNRQEPLFWFALRQDLALFGKVEQHAYALKLEESPCAAFIKSIQPGQHSLGGISLDTGLFFSGIGLFLGILALGSFPAICTLWAGRMDKDPAWILGFSGLSGILRLLGESIAILFSLGLVAMPVLLLVLQFRAHIQYFPGEVWCFRLNQVGLLASVVANVFAALALLRLRHRAAKDTRGELRTDLLP